MLGMSVTTFAAIVGAVTAITAAVFSGLTLLLTGHRETRKWRRETLLDAVAQFLDGSFGRAYRRIYRLRRSGHDGEVLNALKKRTEEAQRSQDDALTKIRLLASAEVVQAAEKLRKADEEMFMQVVLAKTLPTEEVYESLRLRQKSAREDLIKETRDVLGLDSGAPIAHYSTSSGGEESSAESFDLTDPEQPSSPVA